MAWRRACPRSSSRRSASPIPSPTAPTAAAARGRARPSGSSAIYDRNDSATGIDWRRSASSDHLFVREREWEAAHTVWLWVDLSPSMRFRSSLSKTSKESRAVVLALAMAELLARGGERVGLIGGRPFRGRGATRRVAEILMGETGEAEPAAAGEAQPLLRMPHVQRFPRAGAGDQRAARGDRSARRARPSRLRSSIRPRRRCPMPAAPSSRRAKARTA